MMRPIHASRWKLQLQLPRPLPSGKARNATAVAATVVSDPKRNAGSRRPVSPTIRLWRQGKGSMEKGASPFFGRRVLNLNLSLKPPPEIGREEQHRDGQGKDELVHDAHLRRQVTRVLCEAHARGSREKTGRKHLRQRRATNARFRPIPPLASGPEGPRMPTFARNMPYSWSERT